MFDELCRRSINFARSYVSLESKLISPIASYCINFACCKSPMGRNIFGKLGRLASEEILLHFVEAKCVPVLLYGSEACSINKS